MAYRHPKTHHRRQSVLQARLRRQRTLQSHRLPNLSLPGRQTPRSATSQSSFLFSFPLNVRISTPAEAWAASTIDQLSTMPTDIDAYMSKPLPDLPKTEEEPFIINDHIDKFILLEVAIRLHTTFKHIPHTLSGTSAIAIEDNFSLPYIVSHVSMMVPPECVRSVRCWAIVCGLPRIPGLLNGFGIKASDGRVCIVKIKKSADRFETLDIRLVGGEFEIPILTMRNAANQIAKGYIRDMDAQMPFEIQQEYCEDMRWAINCMVEKGMKFREDNPPKWILDRRFWLPFVLSFPDMADLFKDVGLSVRMGEIVIIPWDDDEVTRHWWQTPGQEGPEREVRETSFFHNDVNDGISVQILGIRLLQERANQQNQRKERERKASAQRQRAKDDLKQRMDAWRRGMHEAADPWKKDEAESTVPSSDNEKEKELEALRKKMDDWRRSFHEAAIASRNNVPESPVLPPDDRNIPVRLRREPSPEYHLEGTLQDLSLLDSFPFPPTEAERRVEQRKTELKKHLLRSCAATQDLHARMRL